MNGTNEITQFLLELMELKGYYAWRQNTRVKSGRLKCTSKEGISDICAIAPNGIFVGIEIKRKGEKLRPKQTEFMQEVSKRGARYYVCRSLDEAQEIIESL